MDSGWRPKKAPEIYTTTSMQSVHVGFGGDKDAARLQSVGHTGGADISSQIIICLFCMRIICDILSFKYVIPVTLENIELTAYLC